MSFSNHTQRQLGQAKLFAASRIQQLSRALAAEHETLSAIETHMVFNHEKTMTHAEIELALGHKVNIT